MRLTDMSKYTHKVIEYDSKPHTPTPEVEHTIQY